MRDHKNVRLNDDYSDKAELNYGQIVYSVGLRRAHVMCALVLCSTKTIHVLCPMSMCSMVEPVALLNQPIVILTPKCIFRWKKI